MKIIITGGHLSPALALIESLSKNDEVLLVGRKNTFEGDKNLSFEHQTAKSLDIPFKAITTGRLQRTFTKYTIVSLLKFPIGLVQSIGIVSKYKADVIVSFGGYVGLPVVIAGWFFRIPIIIHEQSLKAGLANRISAFFATKICISWQSSKEFFPKTKTVITGIPIKKFRINPFDKSKILEGGLRTEFKIEEENLPLLYITGGSAGSHTINNLVEGCITKLLEKYNVIHQTGDSLDFNDFDKLSKLKENLNPEYKKRYIITKFINHLEIGSIMKNADLVISRSGINTVSELIYFGKIALLIPLNNEQKENAHFMKSLGIAEVADQETIASEELYLLINSIIENRDNYEKNITKTKNILPQNAAEKLLSVIKSVVSSA